MKLLIADDSAVTRRMLESTLVRAGYSVTSTANGLDAFNLLKSDGGPTLAILDVRMPGMEGTEICRRLREIQLSPPPYIILLTANSNKADMVAGLEAGADDYIIKPFDRAELLARVRVGERIVGLQTNLASHIHILEETSENLQRSSHTLAEVNKNLVTEISERKRAEEAMVLKTLELQSLVDAMTNFVGNGNWRETCQLLLQGALKLTNSRIAFFWGENEEPSVIIHQEDACSGIAVQRVNGQSIDESVQNLADIDAIKQRIRQCENPLVINQRDSVNLETHFSKGSILKNFLGVAIVSESGILGGLGVGNREGDYTLMQIEELRIVAQTAGVLYESDQRLKRKVELEEQLRQSQKLQSIGQLAAGIAHEINTPMQYISDNALFLEDAFTDITVVVREYQQAVGVLSQAGVMRELLADLDKTISEKEIEYLSSEIPKAIQQTREGAERVTNIVRSLKDFAHPDSIEMQAVDLNRAITSTIAVATGEWKYVADITLDLEENLPLVPCRLGEFNQALLNLIVNAAHAIGDVVGSHGDEKGTIEIRSRQDGDWVEVQVKDSGTGIPEQFRSRIFDPFFTTKEVGKGTGQGLLIAHRVIVDTHRGSLTFDTEIGIGTTFTFRLPLAA